MKSELIVDVQTKDVSIALLEDSRLVSLQKESRDNAYAVGDIYLAKVKKLMPGLNAAFVNVGYEKDAFLHYLDLGPHYASYKAYVTELLAGDRKQVPALDKMTLLPDIDKEGKITDALTQGQELLVQIVKEPISSKGPRLTTEIHFTGRFMVLIPFSDKISISQKIKSTEEKMRLRYLIQNIKPANFGVIVRTSAEGVRAAELVNELKTLLGCWDAAMAKAQRSTPPALVFEEESRVVGMLRDVFSPSFEAIHVNHPETFAQLQNYVSLISPDKRDIVKLYQSQQPIFDAFGITRQIKSSFGKTVSFRSGAYIIIESTEACHVVDVNSGNRTKASNDQETNALEVNLRAADEIARQLRLRDMGGIIVVDFIDMNKGEHRQQLYEHMREIMANDRARHNILPLSKFGLMQITRQRVRPALTITTAETCPSCFGKGVVQPSLLFTDTLDEKLDYVVNTLELRDFVMYVHPFVDAYIKRGIFTSLYGKWRRKYGRVFKILPDESLAYLQYRVLDKENNEIDLKEEKDMNASTADKVNNKTRKRTQDPSTEGLTDLEIAEGVVETPAPAKPQKPADAPAVETEDSPAETAPAKKRRCRKKKTASTADETQPEANVTDTEAVATAQESESQPQAEPQVEAPSESAQQETPAKPKRRRRPKAKTNPDAANAEKSDAEIKLLPPPSTENSES